MSPSLSKHLFRPPTRYWLMQGVKFGLIVLLFVGFMPFVEGIAQYLLPAVGLALILMDWHEKVRSVWGKWLAVDDLRLAGRARGISFRAAWSEVIVARPIKIRHQDYLMLSTAHGTLHFPLIGLDQRKIWSLVTCYAPQAVTAHVHTHLPDYDAWLRDQQDGLQQLDRPLRVHSYPIFRLFYLPPVLLIYYRTLIHFEIESAMLSFLGLGLSLALLLMLLYNVVEISGTHLASINLFGKFQMAWAEVERIEHDPNWNILVFYSKGQRLVILGPELWPANAKGALVYEVLLAQIEVRHLTMIENKWVWFQRSSGNVRVAWFAW